MKKLIASIALIAMSFMASSQVLAPKMFFGENDTVMCFTIDQSRIIAKHLVNSIYCDSIQEQQENQIRELQQMVQVKDSSILILNHKIQDQQSIIGSQGQMIENLNAELSTTLNKLRRERWLKRIFAAGMVLIGAASIATSN